MELNLPSNRRSGISLVTRMIFLAGLVVALVGLVPIPAAQGAPDAASVTKSVDDTTPIPGQTITYTIVIENIGLSDETNGVVSDALDSDLTFVGPVTLEGSTGSVATSAGDLPTLASGITVTTGSRVTVTFPVMVNGSTSGGTTIDNTAAFTSDQTSVPETDNVQVTVADPDCFARQGSTDYSSYDSSAVQDAIDAATAGTTVMVAGTCVGVQSAGGGDQVAYINKNLTLAGGYTYPGWTHSGATTILDADSLGRVVRVAGTVTVGIQDLTIRNGVAPGVSGAGGGLHVGAGTVTLSGNTIRDNTASHGGGAYVDAGGLTLSSGEVSHNDADRGAGVYVNASSATFSQTGGSIHHNAAVERGGGIFVRAGSGTLTDGVISYNTALHGGGVAEHEASGAFTQNGGVIEHNSITGNNASGAGIYIYYGHFEMTAGEIRYNDSEYYGGGVDISRGTGTLSGGRVHHNTATYGGGLVADFSTVTLSGVEISYNSSTYGGGVHTYEGQVTFNSGQIVNNTASSSGGGVYINLSPSVFTQNGGVISNNAANRGGGIYLYQGDGVLNGGEVSTNTVTNSGGGVAVAEPSADLTQNAGSVIQGNTASENGGGINVSDGDATVRGTVTGNSARFGGGTYVLTGTATFDGATITANSVTHYGGGVFFQASGVTVDGGEISDNSAGIRGGGVYVSGGTTSVTNATIDNNGTGLYVGESLPGSLTVTDSTIENNATAGLIYDTGSNNFNVTLGGTSGTSNSFSGNGQNVIVYAINTRLPVSAIWNNWGAGLSTLSDVEDTIDHQFDNAALARVNYYTVAVDATPSTQPADGSSPVQVTATLGGNPHLGAGEIVDFVASLGSLSAPSASTNGSNMATVSWTSSVVGTGVVSASAHVDPIPAIVATDSVNFGLPTPALSIAKSVLPTSGVAYHGTVTYTVVVENAGTGPDTVSITDTLPSQVDFGGWLVQPAGATVTADEIRWTGSIAAGTAVTLTFTADHVGMLGDVVNNTARYSGASGSGQDSASFLVEGGVQLYIPLVKRQSP